MLCQFLAGLLFNPTLKRSLSKLLTHFNSKNAVFVLQILSGIVTCDNTTKHERRKFGYTAKVFTKASTSNTSTPTAKMWVQFRVLVCRSREANTLQPSSSCGEKPQCLYIFTTCPDCLWYQWLGTGGKTPLRPTQRTLLACHTTTSLLFSLRTCSHTTKPRLSGSYQCNVKKKILKL